MNYLLELVLQLTIPQNLENKRNPVCAPFTDLKLDLDKNRIDFLKNLWRFLASWESCHKCYGKLKLSSQTFFSLKFSCKSLVSILNHVFYERNFKFFLTVKLQTDCLEGRFGIYRQTNGGSYHITLNQLIASEKKLRTISALKLDRSLLKVEDLPENERSNNFFEKIQIDIPEILYQDINADFGRLIYTGGYIIAEIIQHIECKACAACLTFNEKIDDYKFYQYILSITRDGLKIPSNNFVDLLYRCQIIFEKHIMPFASSDMDLLNRKNLIKLYRFFMNLSYVIILNCKMLQEKCTSLIFKIFSNCLFNNFTKIINDVIESSKTKQLKLSNADGKIQLRKFY